MEPHPGLRHVGQVVPGSRPGRESGGATLALFENTTGTTAAVSG
ncbi:hypothetical protein OG897_39695 [Streptomyces sp. NBC_00237]|nr:hypothetical protein [Streptomyces sp. NBC_00237]MCX5207515.1 hypothetical protein [Streptomyces sp. NBC_00237]